MPPEIVEMPVHLINRSSRLLTRLGEERLQALGLAIAQVPVFYALKDGSALTQKELARLAKTEQPTMAVLLDRMERDGLIQRSPNPHDKRSSLISLTRLALQKVPAAKEIMQRGNDEALAGFTERETTTLVRLLSRVVRNLDPDVAGNEAEG
ncbi:MarR family transcriptional regulator for hemolysin [Caballeronia udeis]|jgi:DNA-binding MarR family transcriptional regulator|uniref:MarR family transcriptional regulator for hemolysin n=1 Tax=Caballeronia udeis TaxID=1232866 RepID=A0ABW8MZD7_9BURK